MRAFNCARRFLLYTRDTRNIKVSATFFLTRHPISKRWRPYEVGFPSQHGRRHYIFFLYRPQRNLNWERPAKIVIVKVFCFIERGEWSGLGRRDIVVHRRCKFYGFWLVFFLLFLSCCCCCSLWPYIFNGPAIWGGDKRRGGRIELCKCYSWPSISWDHLFPVSLRTRTRMDEQVPAASV